MRLLKNKKIFSVLLAMVMIFSMSINAFAATASVTTAKSSTKMSVYVPSGSYAFSNSVNVRFTSPAGANASSITVSAPLSSHSGNPVVIQYFKVTAPSGNQYIATVATGNSSTISINPTESLVGTWSVQAYCYCPSGMYSYGSSTYYQVSIKATY